tara:strand:+ start:2281 stop:2934 length:654 start_codon:yes stop_codon:yes gene_type:complete
MSIFYIPEYNCVFNHIPKTAGRSIKLGFFKKRLNTQLEGGYINWPSRYRQKWSFAFVRNPYDRFISAYNFTKKTLDHNYNITEFLDIARDETINHLYSDITKPLEYIRHHTFPQTHIDHFLKETIFIGRYENLEQDFNIVCNKIGAEYSRLPKYNVSKNISKESFLQSIYYMFIKKPKITYEKHYCNLIGTKNINKFNDYFREDFVQLNYKMIQVKT